MAAFIFTTEAPRTRMNTDDKRCETADARRWTPMGLRIENMADAILVSQAPYTALIAAFGVLYGSI